MDARRTTGAHVRQCQEVRGSKAARQGSREVKQQSDRFVSKDLGRAIQRSRGRKQQSSTSEPTIYSRRLTGSLVRLSGVNFASPIVHFCNPETAVRLRFAHQTYNGEKTVCEFS